MQIPLPVRPLYWYVCMCVRMCKIDIGHGCELAFKCWSIWVWIAQTKPCTAIQQIEGHWFIWFQYVAGHLNRTQEIYYLLNSNAWPLKIGDRNLKCAVNMHFLFLEVMQCWSIYFPNKELDLTYSFKRVNTCLPIAGPSYNKKYLTQLQFILICKIVKAN